MLKNRQATLEVWRGRGRTLAWDGMAEWCVSAEVFITVLTLTAALAVALENCSQWSQLEEQLDEIGRRKGREGVIERDMSTEAA